MFYSEALKKWTREIGPLQWAMTQNNLGNALLNLGKRESGTEMLTKVAAANCEALTVFDKARSPYYWQGTQGNLDKAQALIAARKARAGASPGK